VALRHYGVMRRIRTAAAGALAFVVVVLGLPVVGLVAGPGPARAGAASAGPISVQPDCLGLLHPGGLLALTVHGDLEAVAPGTRRSTEVASGMDPHGGVAVRPQLDAAYVTATGPDGRAAVWSVPLHGCQPESTLVRPDAELPSVSPDGGYLGYVTLDRSGAQTGVAIVGLGARGRPVGRPEAFRAISTPPPLPITGIAVGRQDAVLAVWGGSVDPYLGKKQPTVSTLVPSTARSLRALVPVFDAEGGGPPPLSNAHQDPVKDWQAAPAYLPDGNFVVGDHNSGISMPFRTENGGGIRYIAADTGPLVSLAAGPDGALAWVEQGGGLVVSPHAIELPFGPGAETAPRTTAAPLYVARGHFTAVAWSEGPRAETTPLPRVYQSVPHLPSVVGLSTAQATAVMDALDLPVRIATTVVNPNDPAGTVLAQDPLAGDGVACQCEIELTVSSAA
jgi:PASTA domain